jgi:hypothetical protein
MAITSDAGQMASDNQSDTASKQNDQDRSHVKYVFSVMMWRRHVLDSRKKNWWSLVHCNVRFSYSSMPSFLDLSC